MLYKKIYQSIKEDNGHAGEGDSQQYINNVVQSNIMSNERRIEMRRAAAQNIVKGLGLKNDRVNEENVDLSMMEESMRRQAEYAYSHLQHTKDYEGFNKIYLDQISAEQRASMDIAIKHISVLRIFWQDKREFGKMEKSTLLIEFANKVRQEFEKSQYELLKMSNEQLCENYEKLRAFYEVCAAAGETRTAEEIKMLVNRIELMADPMSALIPAEAFDNPAEINNLINQFVGTDYPVSDEVKREQDEEKSRLQMKKDELQRLRDLYNSMTNKEEGLFEEEADELSKSMVLQRPHDLDINQDLSQQELEEQIYHLEQEIRNDETQSEESVKKYESSKTRYLCEQERRLLQYLEYAKFIMDMRIRQLRKIYLNALMPYQVTTLTDQNILDLEKNGQAILIVNGQPQIFYMQEDMIKNNLTVKAKNIATMLKERMLAAEKVVKDSKEGINKVLNDQIDNLRKNSALRYTGSAQFKAMCYALFNVEQFEAYSEPLSEEAAQELMGLLAELRESAEEYQAFKKEQRGSLSGRTEREQNRIDFSKQVMEFAEKGLKDLENSLQQRIKRREEINHMNFAYDSSVEELSLITSNIEKLEKFISQRMATSNGVLSESVLEEVECYLENIESASEHYLLLAQSFPDARILEQMEYVKTTFKQTKEDLKNVRDAMNVSAALEEEGAKLPENYTNQYYLLRTLKSIKDPDFKQSTISYAKLDLLNLLDDLRSDPELTEKLNQIRNTAPEELSEEQKALLNKVESLNMKFDNLKTVIAYGKESSDETVQKMAMELEDLPRVDLLKDENALQQVTAIGTQLREKTNVKCTFFELKEEFRSFQIPDKGKEILSEKEKNQLHKQVEKLKNQISAYKNSNNRIISYTDSAQRARAEQLEKEIDDFTKTIAEGNRAKLNEELSSIREHFGDPLKVKEAKDTHHFDTSLHKKNNPRREQERRVIEYKKFVDKENTKKVSNLRQHANMILDRNTPADMPELTNKVWRDMDALLWIAENAPNDKQFSPAQKINIMNRLARIAISSAISKDPAGRNGDSKENDPSISIAIRNAYKKKPMDFVEKLAGSTQFKNLIGKMDSPADLRKVIENDLPSIGNGLIATIPIKGHKAEINLSSKDVGKIMV